MGASFMDNIRKLIIVDYCLAVLFSVLFVPWKVVFVKQTENGVLVNINSGSGYSFIFSPLPSFSVIDYGLVTLELIAITAIAAIFYVMSNLKQVKVALEKKGWTDLHPSSWTKCVRVVGRNQNPREWEKGSCHEATKKIQHRAQTSGC